MPVDTGTRQSFEYLLAQVSKQLEDTLSILEAPDPKLARRVGAREDQIDVLKHTLKTRNLNRLGRMSTIEKEDLDLTRAIDIIVDNLESIADYCSSVLVQHGHLLDPCFVHQFEPANYVYPITQGLSHVMEGLFERRIEFAVTICASEQESDTQFKFHFDRIVAALKTGNDVEDLVSSLFILRYFERMADALLNIGEAIIGTIVGEPLKFGQYIALGESIEAGLGVGASQRSEASQGIPIPEFQFESIAETRSGCRIGRVQVTESESTWAIFKEGDLEKVRKERDGIERWYALDPSLAPRVFHYREATDKASLLLEMIDGTTFQRITVDHTLAETAEALEALDTSLSAVWKKTRVDGPSSAAHTKQLQSRLDDVLHLHPDFDRSATGIGELEVPSLPDTLATLDEIEKELVAPFAVLIHGDLNTDNILYETAHRRISFVDLHRSRMTDYVQDVSVFLVSNIRLPIMEDAVRQRLNWVTKEFLRFAIHFAAEEQDHAFQARLAVGLIRSLTTSTRFVMPEDLAKAMFLRANYLLEKLLDHRGRPWESFQLPADSLRFS